MTLKENRTYQEAINRAIEYIEAHSAESLSVDKIAQVALISKFHFHRIFRTVVGDTLHGYLNKVRLNHGANLLKNSTKAISEIAFEVVFMPQKRSLEDSRDTLR